MGTCMCSISFDSKFVRNARANGQYLGKKNGIGHPKDGRGQQTKREIIFFPAKI
jgi:hypothetical protein